MTAIERQKRNPRRVSVFLDGRFAFGVEAVEGARLRVGQWLEDTEIEALQLADERQAAYQQAVRFVSYRPRSVHEIRINLVRKSFSEATIEHAIEQLREVGLADDEAFARYWVEQRESFRPRSVPMLRHELAQRGVDRDVVAAALGDVDEEELAYQAARRWASKASMDSAQQFTDKLTAFLARRGFSYPLVRATTERLLDETGLKSDLLELEE